MSVHGTKIKVGVGGKDTGKSLDSGVMATSCEGGSISNLVPNRPVAFRANQGLPVQPFHMQRLLLYMKVADAAGLGIRPFGVHLGPGPVPYPGNPLLSLHSSCLSRKRKR